MLTTPSQAEAAGDPAAAVVYETALKAVMARLRADPSLKVCSGRYDSHGSVGCCRAGATLRRR